MPAPTATLAQVPGTTVRIGVVPVAGSDRKHNVAIDYTEGAQPVITIEFPNEREARIAANTAWASIVAQRNDGTLAARSSAHAATQRVTEAYPLKAAPLSDADETRMVQQAEREQDARAYASKPDWFDAVQSPRAAAPASRPAATTARRDDAVPAIKAAAALLPDVKSCGYALRTEGVVKFYRVDKPQSGKWAGYTFLKVQASDDFHAIRNLTTVASVLEAIAADVEGALSMYGHELGSCGICSRTLTDEVSRARGIGPVCAAKHGL